MHIQWLMCVTPDTVEESGIDIGIDSEFDPAATVALPLAFDHVPLDQRKLC